MSAPRLSRWLGLLAFACVLALSPRAARATQRINADFDGDGQRDQVTVDISRSPVVLRVWLSTAQHPWVIHSRRPLLRVVAVDLDGDGKPELVATERGTGLRVWKAVGGRLRAVHPRRTGSRLVQRRTGRSFEHDPVGPGDQTTTRSEGDPAALDGLRPVFTLADAHGTLARPFICATLPDRAADPSPPRAPPHPV